MKIASDLILCVSCATLGQDWPEGTCPTCRTSRQPMILTRQAYDQLRVHYPDLAGHLHRFDSVRQTLLDTR